MGKMDKGVGNIHLVWPIDNLRFFGDISHINAALLKGKHQDDNSNNDEDKNFSAGNNFTWHDLNSWITREDKKPKGQHENKVRFCFHNR